jgi:beta-glucosidase-like glycosyl hydrolase/CubicO group peptidase (beta-lactamase class C family)
MPVHAQFSSRLPQEEWVDSVFRTLSPDEKIGQLMVVRLSSITATRQVVFHDSAVEAAVRNYNIGSICLFQGAPVKQAAFVNHFQSIARTPILMTIDGENGVGMRLDSVAGLPRQMMLGAVRDPDLIYRYGRWVAEQCRRLGIHVNYAPVVDVNNNPANPVINDRSFGENKEIVAQYGLQYMRGMQDAGVMASAKHFPGHGDVSVDSHHDLPVINKSRGALDSLELYPFRELIRGGVGSVMVAHLSVPVIDNTANRPTSISVRNVTGLLREELGFKGLTFTDALEMKGVSKFFPDGQASVEALIAGNDMLCLPGDIPTVVARIRKAIKKRKLSWAAIDEHVRRVLRAKYAQGLANMTPVKLEGLTADLNRRSPEIRREVALKAVTLARYEDPSVFPLTPGSARRVALISLGTSRDNEFTRKLRLDHDADVFHFDYRQSVARVPSILELIRQRYDVVVVAIQGLTRFPGKQFGMSDAAVQLWRDAIALKPHAVVLFGNPYAAQMACQAKNLLVCYEDEPITRDVASEMVSGRLQPAGRLPVTVCENMPAGTGKTFQLMPAVSPLAVGMRPETLGVIDSLAHDAIRQQATPGCVVLVARKGRIVYQKAFGYQTYDSVAPVQPEMLWDMASVTKICATTLSVMKLYDQGRLSLEGTLGDYLPWTRGSDKEGLRIRDILLHQARLKSFIPFYRETIDTATGVPREGFYRTSPGQGYDIRVTEGMYMRNDFRDTMYRRMVQSKLEKPDNYIYSDNDFIFLGKIVESISGLPLDAFVAKEFYRPMGLVSPGFRPLERFPKSMVAPTEAERIFRRSLVHGDVHDPGAALFGGVAGHAGLFSSAYDIAVLMQMLLNKGVMNGRRYLSDSTIDLFTAYHSNISRRGLGFDKPEKDNATRKDAYPTLSASTLTFGHTGFTGTCAWADPAQDLVYVFVSNRVHPDGSNKLLRMNVRSNIHEQIYQALR